MGVEGKRFGVGTYVSLPSGKGRTRPRGQVGRVLLKQREGPQINDSSYC